MAKKIEKKPEGETGESKPLKKTVSAASPKAAFVAPVVPPGEPVATKPKKAPAKKPVARKSRASSPASAASSLREIELRAYFIGEKRQREGIPGDAHQDWIEAERQVKAECKPAAPKRKSAAKS